MKSYRRFTNRNGLRRLVATLSLLFLPVLTAAQADDLSPSTSPTSFPPILTLPSPLDLDCGHVRCAFLCDWKCYKPPILMEKYLDCVRDCMDECLGRRGVSSKVDTPTRGCRSFRGNVFGYVLKAKRSAWKRLLPRHF